MTAHCGVNDQEEGPFCNSSLGLRLRSNSVQPEGQILCHSCQGSVEFGGDSCDYFHYYLLLWSGQTQKPLQWSISI